MGLYDEVEIEDMAWDAKLRAFTFQCPCGDLFQITLEELRAGEDIARCPSCSLYVQVIFEPESLDALTPKEALPPEGGPKLVAPVQ